MKYKKITTVIIASVLFFQSTFPVLAYDLGGQSLLKDVNHWQNQASHAAAVQQMQLQDVIKHADTMITNRITSLSALSTRIQNDTRLTTDEKTSLSSSIQTAINGLTTLKAKL